MGFLNKEALQGIADTPMREQMVMLKTWTITADASGHEPICLPNGMHHPVDGG